MKKQVLIFLLMFLPFSTLAKESFYLKGGVGFNYINNSKFSKHDFTNIIKLSDSFPLIEAGIGYQFNNSIRIEAVIDYYFLFRTLATSIDLNNDTFKVLTKTKVDTFMFNIYKDIINFNKLNFFIGGGIGIAHFKESANGHVLLSEDNVYLFLDKINSKNRKHLAYKFTVGTDVKISDYIKWEMSYNYFNLGNNKKKTLEDIPDINNQRYRIHNITIGIRYSL
jgi:opacity protein-like surface antigen